MKRVLVWDWPIRVFHWLMVVLFLGMIITGKSEEDYLELHIDLGYVFSGVLVARIIYGFLGSYHGQFKQGLSSFKKIRLYTMVVFKSLKAHKNDDQRTKRLGHNPLGWVMVFALITLLSMQLISGLFFTDDIFWYGPFYDYASDDVLELLAQLHRILPDVLIALVILHISAVLLHEVRFKEKLIIAMIHGHKPIGVTSDVPLVKTPRVGVVMSLGVSLVWLIWLFSLPS
ncbi:cytochrome b/b6 domain-containing protein [Marinomonas sp. 2405UD68-3]|uniref:cytochrome b/b6 domain-containing protein n=1 Tax=Marinomonas sp. 2405UD68-3 TaxID=3391835 RepID=UPI0039C9DB9D